MRKKSQKIKLNKEDGISTADALIAIGILALFAGIIATIAYNLHLATVSTNRISSATYYIVSTFEYIELTDYPDGQTDTQFAEYLVGVFNNDLFNGDTLVNAVVRDTGSVTPTPPFTPPFLVEITVRTFDELSDYNTLPQVDLIREITMAVNYTVGNRVQRLEMTRIIQR